MTASEPGPIITPTMLIWPLNGPPQWSSPPAWPIRLWHLLAHRFNQNRIRLEQDVALCMGCDWRRDLYAQLPESVRCELEGR